MTLGVGVLQDYDFCFQFFCSLSSPFKVEKKGIHCVIECKQKNLNKMLRKIQKAAKLLEYRVFNSLYSLRHLLTNNLSQ